MSADTVGLVAELNFDEGIGSTVHDAANTNDGTLSGGKFGNGLKFDGVNDYVNIPDNPTLDITENITLEAWIKINNFSTSAGYHMYIIGKDSAGQRSYGIGVDLTWQKPKKPFVIMFHSGGSNQVAWGLNELVVNQWYHIAGVFDYSANQLKLYVNGVYQTTQSDPSTVYPGTADLRIGGRQYAGHECYFNGIIDEVRISNNVRYTSSFPPQTTPFTPDATTVGLWHFDESVGTTASDDSSNGNHGTINGAAWAGPIWVPHESGYALSFDGIDDFVTIDNEENFDFDYDDAFSIEAWFLTDSDACINIVSKYDNDAPNRGFQLIKHSSSWGNALYFFLTNTYAYPGGNQIRCNGATDVADGAWHHVVVTYDGSGSLSGLHIYLDDVAETLSSSADTVTSNTTNNLPLQISGREGTHYVFDGYIDEVHIWNYALDGLNLAFDPTSDAVVAVNTAANIRTVVTDGLGNTVEGVTVTLSSTDGLTIPSSGQTNANGVFAFTASSTTAGIYTITATLSTPAGPLQESWILAVYDPTAGFVTGGGWIYSPAGAYKPDVTLEGKASFGFVSKYKKGQSTPDGNTEFQFKAGNLNFHSSSYEWLVISGAKAMYKGIGTINGAGSYKFMITAWDGQLNGGDDTFRIKIWYEENGSEIIVYDNGVDTVLGGGQIKIHS
ncbi:MAG: LamG-like jellyroll fold domain-containing protein [Candidatus Thermoplasmatota archaeon]